MALTTGREVERDGSCELTSGSWLQVHLAVMATLAIRRRSCARVVEHLVIHLLLLLALIVVLVVEERR